MANIKIDPEKLQWLNYANTERDSCLVFNLVPNEPALMGVRGAYAQGVVKATSKVDRRMHFAVKFTDIFKFVRAAKIYKLTLGEGNVEITAEGMTAKFATIHVDNCMVRFYEPPVWQQLPGGFVDAIKTFGGIAGASGTLREALFIKDGYLIATDTTRYVRAAVGIVDDMILAPVDARLLEGMTHYSILDGRVYFRGKGRQGVVSTVEASYPPILNVDHTISPITVTREQLQSLPTDIVTIYTERNCDSYLLILEAAGDYSVRQVLGSFNQTLFARFTRKGMIDGLQDGATCEIAHLRGQYVFRVTKQNYEYLLAGRE